jgi:hypothetical protein
MSKHANHTQEVEAIVNILLGDSVRVDYDDLNGLLFVDFDSEQVDDEVVDEVIELKETVADVVFVEVDDKEIDNGFDKTIRIDFAGEA